jgi:CRISPR-associated endoribonuclease Cas6
MKIIELKCTVYIKNDISFDKSFEILSQYISWSMCQDEKLEILHNDYKSFKNYCFGGFYPTEKEKIYKKGKTYTFSIKTIDDDFVNRIIPQLTQNTKNESFIIVDINKRVISQHFITEIYTATPVIVTMKNKMFWMKEDDIMLLQNQLQQNLLNKYKAFYDEELEPTQNFIQLLELKNNRSQTIKLTNKEGKRYRLFGNKFRIIPNEDEVSQKLAFLALGVGLGEKSGYGGGFCVGKGMQ